MQPHSCQQLAYLEAQEFTEVRVEVVAESDGRPGQGDAPDQQCQQHDVGRSGRHVHNLRARTQTINRGLRAQLLVYVRKYDLFFINIRRALSPFLCLCYFYAKAIFA